MKFGEEIYRLRLQALSISEQYSWAGALAARMDVSENCWKLAKEDLSSFCAQGVSGVSKRSGVSVCGSDWRSRTAPARDPSRWQ